MTRRDKLTCALRPAEGRTAPPAPAGATVRCDRCRAAAALLADGQPPRGWFRLLSPRLVERRGWFRRQVGSRGPVEVFDGLLCPRCLAPVLHEVKAFWKGGAR